LVTTITGSGGGTAGESAGTLTDSTSAHDTFTTSTDHTGFAPFEWDGSVATIQSIGNAGPDVINNFQVDQDMIVLEGSLLESTIVGHIDVRLNGGGFNLDSDEYAVVASSDRTLNASELSDVTKVAELLNTLFQFDAGSADEVLNTSIFAVTAKDDPTQTAIWAHRQSATNDATVDAIELYQLAVVHTTGDEFAAHDLYLQTLTV